MAGAITSECHQADLRLGHAAQAVALDAQQPLDGDRAEPGLDLDLDELGVGQLPVADAIVGERCGGPGGLADEHQQLDRHAGPLGELRERDAAERREPLVGGLIEEVERDLAAPDGGAQAVERDARGDQAAHQPTRRTSPRRESAVGVRCVTMPSSTSRLSSSTADAGSPGRLGSLVRVHGPYSSEERPRMGRWR